MRLFFAIIIIALNSALGLGQVAEFHVDKATIKFPKTAEGKLLEHTYKITNEGSVPLIISDYEVACSCTNAILPTNPIQPGETFDLKVTFDTNGKYYFQDRTVILYTNTKKGKETLRFKVKVIPREE
jgi:LEA14-like dessication related protein